MDTKHNNPVISVFNASLQWIQGTIFGIRIGYTMMMVPILPCGHRSVLDGEALGPALSLLRTEEEGSSCKKTMQKIVLEANFT